MRYNIKRGIALTGVVWSIASGLAVVLTGLGISFASSTTQTLGDHDKELAVHATAISQLKDSACVQNSNIRNIAAAVHATFVPDPHCTSN